jgi:oligosaccharide repeat unit polymerase
VRAAGFEDFTVGNGKLVADSTKATGTATIVFLVGLGLTYLGLPSESAGSVFAGAAIGIGLSLLTSTTVEARAGVHGLIRVDILMLWVLYGLTFLEFLFPQPDIEGIVAPDVATKGVIAAMLGFAGIAIGRHLVPRRRKPVHVSFANVAPRNMFMLFVLAAAVGYLHILLAVNFDLVEMFRQMALPRFEQAWSRGRFGNAHALLVEIGALLYLIPPIAGLIYARHTEFGFIQKSIVTLVLSVTVYYAFASGTRNILAVYVFTLFGSYYLNKPHIKLWRLVAQGILVLALLLAVTSYMLAFRNVGIGNFSFSERSLETLYIDHNMVVLSTLTDAFPAIYDFLGLEIPYSALVRPIPRALWPGKPEGLSVSVESVLGITQATLSCTFVGEAYIMGGMLGVVLIAILFGAAGEMWNEMRQKENSAFSQLLYASGFFCAAISMRSMLWTTVTMLPTLALWLYGRIWLARGSPTRSRASAKSVGR